jgi:glycosyltransferase involved in cell wall biosynthesis
MLSIIIPALNEENYLPFLLESIKKQSFKDYEIIIADAGSKDKTLDIARQYGCRIAPGGLPAKGRNEGAKIAKGDPLLFLDADIILPDCFLKNVAEKFKLEGIKTASFFLSPWKKSFFHQFLFYFFYNVPILIFQKVFPHVAMAILVDKETFYKIDGFNENVKFAEDHDLAVRAAKVGKLAFIPEKVFVFTRRFEADGWIATYLKYFFSALFMIFRGPMKKDIFEYKFDHYSKNKK